MPEVTFGHHLPVSGRGVEQRVGWVGRASAGREIEMVRDRGRKARLGRNQELRAGFPRVAAIPPEMRGRRQRDRA